MAKQELISELPSSAEERKKIKGIVSELVDLMIKAEDIKSQIKDIKDVAKEDNGYDPKMISFYADLEFDEQYNASKKRADLEGKLEKANEFDVLMGR